MFDTSRAEGARQVDGVDHDREAQTRRVLRALETDGRLTPAQLARITGVDQAVVAEIVERCERSGIIRGYKAVVAWERVRDERVVAFIDVGVDPQRDFGFDQVAARIYRYPEVRSVHLVSGGSDLRVTVEGDSLRNVAAFVSEKLAVVDGVRSTNTHFLLKTYKDAGEILAEDAAADDRLPVAP
jgi:DNA-binding Lrp family transcriptional regulator